MWCGWVRPSGPPCWTAFFHCEANVLRDEISHAMWTTIDQQPLGDPVSWGIILLVINYYYWEIFNLTIYPWYMLMPYWIIICSKFAGYCPLYPSAMCDVKHRCGLNHNFFDVHEIQGCWKVLSSTRKETSYSDRRVWVSYVILIIIIGGILVLFIFIYITRLESNEIFSISNKIHREVGRAKDLSAPLYCPFYGEEIVSTNFRRLQT
jgi:hypothetical protein